MATTIEKPPLTVETPLKTQYAVPIWLRDQQIRRNLQTVKDRIQPHYALRTEPIAVVGFGPSLNDTWKQIKRFAFVITCSGAHKFLLERGIVPTWHLEVDPRAHKIELLGPPHADVEYLPASTCHPAYVQHLLDHQAHVKLWHVFDTAEEGFRLLPHGEWALCGGCSAGLRALTMARFLGFTDLHIFGLDGCAGSSGKHAAHHPLQAKTFQPVDYKGVTYQTSPAFLEAARGTFHELDQMVDVKATFYGDGLVQAMAKDYVPKHRQGGPEIGFIKEPLITEDYAALNRQLHRDQLGYGVGGSKYVEIVKTLATSLKTSSILDYGAGKGLLAQGLPFPIWEYDPCVEGKTESPRPADLVICTDVLEHIEPDRLVYVLGDLQRCVKQCGYFVVHTGPAKKTLADGRNAHLIQQDHTWWHAQLAPFFKVAKIKIRGPELHIVVGPKKGKTALSASTLTALRAGGPVVFDWRSLVWRTEPYPIAVAANVLEMSTYRTLAAAFPPLELCRAFGGQNKKWSLSTVNHHDQYVAFVNGHPAWSAFAQSVKSVAFLESLREALKGSTVDPFAGKGKLKTRFEFSILPADGGCLRAHTDIPSKLVTVVLGMSDPEHDPWDPAWGGGTAVLQPKGALVLDDYQAEFSDFDVIETYPYQPNQAVVFVKTDRSWHGVEPMTGPASALRKTVTINVERGL